MNMPINTIVILLAGFFIIEFASYRLKNAGIPQQNSRVQAIAQAALTVMTWFCLSMFHADIQQQARTVTTVLQAASYGLVFLAVLLQLCLVPVVVTRMLLGEPLAPKDESSGTQEG